MIKIKKGLDFFISGVFEQIIIEGKFVCYVVLIGFDYNGMKLMMVVKEGDCVKCGMLLFMDKKIEGVCYILFVVGVVKEINCGEWCVF